MNQAVRSVTLRPLFSFMLDMPLTPVTNRYTAMGRFRRGALECSRAVPVQTLERDR